MEWDPHKARKNFEKHGVDFADAALALEDSEALTAEDEAAEGEQRFVTLGLDPFGSLLVVVYTHREEAIRIISARRANKREQRQYGERR